MFGVEKEFLLSGFIGSIIGVSGPFFIYVWDISKKLKKEKEILKKLIRSLYVNLKAVNEDPSNQEQFIEVKNDWKENRKSYAILLDDKLFGLLDSICKPFYYKLFPKKEAPIKEVLEFNEEIHKKFKEAISLLEKEIFKKGLN